MKSLTIVLLASLACVQGFYAYGAASNGILCGDAYATNYNALLDQIALVKALDPHALERLGEDDSDRQGHYDEYVERREELLQKLRASVLSMIFSESGNIAVRKKNRKDLLEQLCEARSVDPLCDYELSIVRKLLRGLPYDRPDAELRNINDMQQGHLVEHAQQRTKGKNTSIANVLLINSTVGNLLNDSSDDSTWNKDSINSLLALIQRCIVTKKKRLNSLVVLESIKALRLIVTQINSEKMTSTISRQIVDLLCHVINQRTGYSSSIRSFALTVLLKYFPLLPADTHLKQVYQIIFTAFINNADGAFSEMYPLLSNSDRELLHDALTLAPLSQSNPERLYVLRDAYELLFPEDDPTKEQQSRSESLDIIIALLQEGNVLGNEYQTTENTLIDMLNTYQQLTGSRFRPALEEHNEICKYAQTKVPQLREHLFRGYVLDCDDLDSPEKKGGFEMHYYLCFMLDYLKGLKKVIHKYGPGDTVNHLVSSGGSLLHVAARFNAVECLDFLLNMQMYKKIINSYDNRGHTPLQQAVYFQCYDAVDLLCNRGARIDKGKDETALHIAADKNDLAMFKKLLRLHKQSGRNVRKLLKNKNYTKSTPRSVARTHNSQDVLAYLPGDGSEPADINQDPSTSPNSTDVRHPLIQRE